MKIIILLLLLPVLFLIILAAQALLATRGAKLPQHSLDHKPKVLGAGMPLTYLVLGDSNAVGVGASKGAGLGPATAEHLSKSYRLTYVNLSVSGAKVTDVLEKQIPEAIKLKPDLVLIVAGGNDVTHLTPPNQVRESLIEINRQLIDANCNIKIEVMGIPAMGTIPRFKQPLRTVAGAYGSYLNNIYKKVIEQQGLTHAPVAEKSQDLFSQQPDSYFSADKFHLNNNGYGVWISVLNHTLTEAINNQPSHCR